MEQVKWFPLYLVYLYHYSVNQEHNKEGSLGIQGYGIESVAVNCRSDAVG